MTRVTSVTGCHGSPLPVLFFMSEQADREAGRHTMKNTNHTITNGFCTVCGETQEWIMENGDSYTIVNALPEAEPKAEHKTADELTPGDVFHYDRMNTWKILERVSETEKMVTYRFEYVHTTYETSRIGTSRVKAFRKATRFDMAD